MGKLYVIISGNNVDKRQIIEDLCFNVPNSICFPQNYEIGIHISEFEDKVRKIRGIVEKGKNIIITTENYLLMQWIDIVFEDKNVVYMSIVNNDKVNITTKFLNIIPNWVLDPFEKAYNEVIKKCVGGNNES